MKRTHFTFPICSQAHIIGKNGHYGVVKEKPRADANIPTLRRRRRRHTVELISSQQGSQHTSEDVTLSLASIITLIYAFTSAAFPKRHSSHANLFMLLSSLMSNICWANMNWDQMNNSWMNKWMQWWIEPCEPEWTRQRHSTLKYTTSDIKHFCLCTVPHHTCNDEESALICPSHNTHQCMTSVSAHLIPWFRITDSVMLYNNQITFIYS